MNYRDMLLMDYFDEDYEVLNEKILSGNQELRQYQDKYNAGKLTASQIKDLEETELKWKVKNPVTPEGIRVDTERRWIKRDKDFNKKQAEIAQKAGRKRKENYAKLGINQEDSEWIQHRNTVFNQTLKDLGVNKNTASKAQLHQAEVAAQKTFPKWAEETAKKRGKLVKINKKLDAARQYGEKDAANGEAPQEEKVSKVARAKGYLTNHKMGAGAIGAGAAGAVGAGIAAKGIHDLATLKNPTKARAAWKASGSNIPFEQWLKKQKKKAGIKTAIGGVATAAGATGAAIMGRNQYKQSHNESLGELLNQFDEVLFEEAYLEGYYGQVIAESYGYASEYDMVMCESYGYDDDYDYYDEDYDDFDDYYDEDYLGLPYFG